MDYLVFGKNIYIKSKGTRLIAYNWHHEFVDEISFNVEDKRIIFNS